MNLGKLRLAILASLTLVASDTIAQGPGTLLWSFETGGNVWSSPAIGADGTVYVGSYDKKVYALNPDGTKQWEFVTGHTVASSPAIGADGTVYVGSYDKKLYALNGKTGAKKWQFTTGHTVASSPAIGADGTVYVGSWGRVYALDGKTGAKQWEFETESRSGFVSSSPAIGADGTIYVGSGDKKVYALDGKTGTKKWLFTTGDGVESSPAIGSDGTVYIGSWNKRVYALDGKTGARQWEFETGGNVQSSPTIGADGTVYVGSNDGSIYAFATSSSGPAYSPWPMFGQNAQRTSRDEPTHTLTVASLNPDNGAKVTVSQVDSERESSGITQFTQEYHKGAKVTLTAERAAGDNRFKVWLKNGEPVSAEPTVTVTMDWDYTLRAVYEPIHTLTVASSNPHSGVTVTVSPPDNEGESSGTTHFTLEYPKGAQVTLTAEQTAEGNGFKRWLKNGEAVSTEPTVTVTMDWDYTLRAVYEPGPVGDPTLKLLVSQDLSNQGQVTIQAVGELRKPFEIVELELSYDLIHWETQDLQLPINLPLSFPLAQDMQFMRVKRIGD